jgi:hypothetical protein
VHLYGFFTPSTPSNTTVCINWTSHGSTWLCTS